MSLVQISKIAKEEEGIAFFKDGFRPFFLAAAFYAAGSMIAWMIIYFSSGTLATGIVSSSQWHAHQMIYGYCMAVIAGFLLTAVENWTGKETLKGRGLVSLFVLWLIARIAFFFGEAAYIVSFVADLTFMIFLMCSVTRPIVHVRQWKQLGILSKLILLTIGNVVFYLGALGYLENWIPRSLFGGVYLIIGLILTILGRVFPGFIENVLPEKGPIKNPLWLSAVNLILFLIFFINQIFFFDSNVLFSTAILLFCVMTLRLILWHRVGIWKHPLLWSMYLSLLWIDFGFILFALSAVGEVSMLFAIHAFSAGGIGIMTMSMMARVILGHTGGNVREPHRGIGLCFWLLIIGVIFRVIFPLIDMSNYLNWILVSQCLWVLSFTYFGLIHSGMLLKRQ